METQRIPVLSLRAKDRIKVGIERFDVVVAIDDREPGVVKVEVASGDVHRFGYHETATIDDHQGSTPAVAACARD